MISKLSPQLQNHHLQFKIYGVFLWLFLVFTLNVIDSIHSLLLACGFNIHQSTGRQGTNGISVPNKIKKVTLDFLLQCHQIIFCYILLFWQYLLHWEFYNKQSTVALSSCLVGNVVWQWWVEKVYHIAITATFSIIIHQEGPSLDTSLGFTRGIFSKIDVMNHLWTLK